MGVKSLSKYTTELRYICESSISLDKSGGYNSVDSIISQARPKIFDFDYPIFDENYRNVLETKIIKHYYTREISEETVGLWKLRLNTKLNEIMPYYNKLYTSELLQFNPLYTHNITRTHKLGLESNRKTDTTGAVNSNGTNVDLFSDTPQGALTGVENETYLTTARKISNNDTSTSSSNGNDNYNSTEDYLENISGYEGKNASELLLKYRKTFLNIDVQVINELETLFFQLW